MARKKDIDYFKLFRDAIEYTCKLSDQLNTLINEYNDEKVQVDLEKRVAEIHKTEHEADMIYHDLVYELNRAFITPIEREDILAIANGIDDICDQIEEVAFSLWIFNIKELRPEINQFMDLIKRCCQKTKESVYEFSNFKKSKTIIDLLHTVGRLENEGDMLYRNSVRKLFETEKDPIEILKWHEILDGMEITFDKCKHLAGILENTIVKNS